MPLIKIPSQPLFANARPSDCFAMCDERDYCMPFIPGDDVMAQFIQTPCGPSITCDSDFSSLSAGDEVVPDGNFNAVGSEETTNGTFTGNATGWSLGTGWAYNSNNIRKTAGVAAGAYQTMPSPLADYGIYVVVFTVTNRTAGTLTPNFYVSGVPGSAISGTSVSTNATFTQYIKVGTGYNQFGLYADASFDGDVDTVSIKRIAATWEFDTDETTGWTINSSGFASSAVLSGGNTGSELICSGILDTGTNYLCDVTIEAGSSGFMRFEFGGNFSTWYSISGAIVLSFVVTSGTGTDFKVHTNAPPAFLGAISLISIEEVADDCWDFDVDLWTITEGALCKTPGTADNLVNSAVLSQGTRYQIKVTIAGMTAGLIQLFVAGVPGSTISSNGTAVQYFTPASDSALTIFASNLFDGCLSDIEIFELKNDYVFELVDLEGNLISTLSDHDGNQYGRVIYYEDYVTLAFKFDETQDNNDRDLEYGCFFVYAYDSCEIQYDEIIVDGGFASPMNIYWMDTSGTAATIVANELTITRGTVGSQQSTIANLYLGGDGTFQFQNNPAILPGAHNYRVSFDVTVNDDPANITVNVLGGYQQPSPRPFLQGTTPVGSYSVDISFDPNYADPTRAWFGVVAQFVSTIGTVKIDNVSVRRIEPFDITYSSVCLKYMAAAPCTKVIRGYCDDDNLGFKFYERDISQPLFKLTHRIPIEAINPSYPENTDDYLFSEGTKQRNYGQTEETFTIMTGLIPEPAHSTIRMQRVCQYLDIGEPLDEFTEYFPLPGDYTPEWNKSGKFILASGRFEVQLKDRGAKFYRRS